MLGLYRFAVISAVIQFKNLNLKFSLLDWFKSVSFIFCMMVFLQPCYPAFSTFHRSGIVLRGLRIRDSTCYIPVLHTITSGVHNDKCKLLQAENKRAADLEPNFKDLGDLYTLALKS